VSFIQTFKGNFFDFSQMHKHPLDIEDIAHALSQVCRFGGHCREFYSVAQHSVYVSQMCKEFPMAGLLHDATEAYVGDMVSPLKRRIPEYRQHEMWLWLVLARQFGLPKEMPAEVKRADEVMLAAEARDLMGFDATIWGIASAPESIRIEPWPCKLAERYFLERFHSLSVEYSRAMAAEAPRV
jgi:hypothetical protein